MVELDRQLIHSVKLVTTGENIHRARELILAYEQAVNLHNRGESSYQPRHEQELRQWVGEKIRKEYLWGG